MKTRPYVTLSFAQSLDGCIASSPRSRRLSCPESIRYTHYLRAGHDAVLIGIGTVIADNPRISVRPVEGKNPLPIVLDSRLRIPLNARLLRGRPLIATTERADTVKQRKLELLGARVIRANADRRGQVDLADLMQRLQKEGIRRLMVEGGSRVITRFLEKKLVDKLVVTVIPAISGGLAAFRRDTALPGMIRLRNVWLQHLGRDIVIQAKPCWKRSRKGKK